MWDGGADINSDDRQQGQREMRKVGGVQRSRSWAQLEVGDALELKGLVFASSGVVCRSKMTAHTDLRQDVANEVQRKNEENAIARV